MARLDILSLSALQDRCPPFYGQGLQERYDSFHFQRGLMSQRFHGRRSRLDEFMKATIAASAIKVPSGAPYAR